MSDILGKFKKNPLPLDLREDCRIWPHITNGDLSLKDVFKAKMTDKPLTQWLDKIWNLDIPPSKAFTVLRLCHDKHATNENLIKRRFF